MALGGAEGQTAMGDAPSTYLSQAREVLQKWVNSVLFGHFVIVFVVCLLFLACVGVLCVDLFVLWLLFVCFGRVFFASSRTCSCVCVSAVFVVGLCEGEQILCFGLKR